MTTSYAPVAKVRNGGIAAFATGLGFYLLRRNGVEVDAELASYLTTGVYFAVAWLTPPISHFKSEFEKRYQGPVDKPELEGAYTEMLPEDKAETKEL